jgi:hypothetical protein
MKALEIQVKCHPELDVLTVPSRFAGFDYTREFVSAAEAVGAFSKRFFKGVDFDWFEEGGTFGGLYSQGWEHNYQEDGREMSLQVDVIELAAGRWIIALVYEADITEDLAADEG